jgi:hypothetical protein
MGKKLYNTPDGRPLWGKTQRKRKPKPRPKEGKPCRCGCGELTGGGEFRIGHDAKYKSALIREARANNAAALAELEQRGWMKFYEKSINNAERKAAIARGERPARMRADGTMPEELASLRLQELAKMKKALLVTNAIGRTPRRVAGDRFIMITRDNYEAILTGDFPEFSDEEREMVKKMQGLDLQTKVC